MTNRAGSRQSSHPWERLLAWRGPALAGDRQTQAAGDGLGLNVHAVGRATALRMGAPTPPRDPELEWVEGYEPEAPPSCPWCRDAIEVGQPTVRYNRTLWHAGCFEDHEIAEWKEQAE